MRKNVLIVHAHPEHTSRTRQFVEVAVQTLQQQGHEVQLSDLYGMHWKAVFDEDDFPSRADPNLRLRSSVSIGPKSVTSIFGEPSTFCSRVLSVMSPCALADAVGLCTA